MPGTNGIRIGRITLATIVSELTPILLLVVVVLIYETRGVDPQTRQAFAERAGMWLGPIAGAIATFGFAVVSTGALLLAGCSSRDSHAAMTIATATNR